MSWRVMECTRPRARVDSRTDGNGFRFGIGIEQYLFRELSVNIGYTSTSVTFDTNPDRDGTIRVIDIGLIYHFL